MGRFPEIFGRLKVGDAKITLIRIDKLFDNVGSDKISVSA